MAAAIAKQFRVPTEAIAQRLSAGRFRVKSNVDLATAERLAAGLEAMGARCAIVDAATGQPIQAAGANDSAADSNLISAEPAAASASPFASQNAAPEPDGQAGHQETTGLAAAFTGGTQQQEMGALAGVDSASYSLETLDGADDVAAASSAMLSSMGAAESSSEDLFRPPDESEDLDTALDVDTPAPPISDSAPGTADTDRDDMLSLLPEEPLAVASVSSAPTSSAFPMDTGPIDAGDPVSAPAVVSSSQGSPLVRARARIAADLGVRIAAGAILAVLLGFIPAHILGAIRESSAYDTPLSNIAKAGEDYRAGQAATAKDLAQLKATLDTQRNAQRVIMNDTRRSIAITGAIIWMLSSGALGFVWMRKIDWQRWG